MKKIFLPAKRMFVVLVAAAVMFTSTPPIPQSYCYMAEFGYCCAYVSPRDDHPGLPGGNGRP